jgi:short-subunit dehydrogenase
MALISGASAGIGRTFGELQATGLVLTAREQARFDGLKAELPQP